MSSAKTADGGDYHIPLDRVLRLQYLQITVLSERKQQPNFKR
jgi:hypothetical protein